MTNTLVQPYLFFGGRCEEALEFYRAALGAQVDMLMHYKDSPEPQPPGMLPPGFGNKVMHTTFRIGGTTLMASDGCAEGSNFGGFSLSLAVPTEAEADRAFAALAAGGHGRMPLAQTFWSPIRRPEGRAASFKSPAFIGSGRAPRSARRVAGRHRPVACATQKRISGDALRDASSLPGGRVRRSLCRSKTPASSRLRAGSNSLRKRCGRSGRLCRNRFSD